MEDQNVTTWPPLWEPTDEVQGPGETAWTAIESHPQFADLADSPDKDKILERMHEDTDLATSTAWALVYFLIERRRTPDLLMQYCQELASLPRDLDEGI